MNLLCRMGVHGPLWFGNEPSHRARVDEIDKIQAINARISQIEKRTQARLLSCSPTFRIGLHVMDVMTEDEKNELHQLKMSLPLFGEEACAAHQRIIERIKSGRRGLQARSAL